MSSLLIEDQTKVSISWYWRQFRKM
jgi:hypothetical protein